MLHKMDDNLKMFPCRKSLNLKRSTNISNSVLAQAYVS